MIYDEFTIKAIVQTASPQNCRVILTCTTYCCTVHTVYIMTLEIPGHSTVHVNNTAKDMGQ